MPHSRRQSPSGLGRDGSFKYNADQMTTEDEPLAADIEIKLKQDYAIELLSDVSRSLATYRGSERNRVIRCVIHLSGGDPLRISYFIGVAAQDYRDVIYWAEYDEKDQKVRDFGTPFVRT
jgi:hypothetical protein